VAEQLVVDRIRDRHSVRILFGGVDAVLMADGYIRIGSSRGRLSGEAIADTDKLCRE
jgi:hypothetical protein